MSQKSSQKTLSLLALIPENTLDLILNRITGLTGKYHEIIQKHEMIYTNSNQVDVCLSRDSSDNYSLSYSSIPDPNYPSLNFNKYSSSVKGDVFTLLEKLDFKYSHDYIKQGYSFYYKPFTIELFRIKIPFKALSPSKSTVFPGMESRLVFQITTDQSELVDAMHRDLIAFTAFFDDLAVFVRVDHKCFARRFDN